MRPALQILIIASLGIALAATTASAAWPPSPYIGGVMLPGMGVTPCVISDGAGGTFIAASNSTVGASVQHLNAAGVPLWPAGGVAAGSSGTLSSPANCALALDGAGGVMVAFFTTGNRVSAQRIDANGNRLWGAAGVALLAATSIDPILLYCCTDGAGGTYVSWGRDRVFHGETLPPTGTISHVDSNGTQPWPGLSVPAPAAMISDGAGGAIYAWSESRGTSSGYDIYAQRVNITGVQLWTSGGANVCNVSSDQLSPVLAGDGAQGAILAWTDMREYVAPDYSIDYFVQRLDSSGAMRWFFGGLPVCRQPWVRGDLAIAPDGIGGATMAWDDARNRTNFNIYAQHIAGNGYFSLPNDGLAVCTAAGDKGVPAVASSGNGGSFIVWHDQRDGNQDLYGCAINAAGTQFGLADGFPVAVAAGDQQEPALAGDGNGAAVCTWTDLRPGASGIRAQRLDPLGYPGDPSPLLTSIRDVPNDQGGKVKLIWNASYLDTIPPYAGLTTWFPVGDYQVYRLTPPSTWQLLTTVPSGPFAQYSAIVGTPGDSTPGNPANATYRINARFISSPNTYHWYSAADSGHSVDNLAPLAPAAFSVTPSSNGALLSWQAGLEPDLANYRIHRLASADEPLSDSNLLATVTGTSFVDPESPACIYELCAVDRHGNPSPPATFAVTSGPPLATHPPAATVLDLGMPNPDPARTVANISFSLAHTAMAQLDVFDVSGRRVRGLVSGSLPSGEHRLSWDLRDDGGLQVRSGLFMVRLTTPGATRMRRLVVVR